MRADWYKSKFLHSTYLVVESIVIGQLVLFLWLMMVFILGQIPYVEFAISGLSLLTQWPMVLWKHLYCPNQDMSVCGGGQSFLWWLAVNVPLFSILAFIGLRYMRKKYRLKFLPALNPPINSHYKYE